MKILAKFNRRYGFTPAESRVILVLISAFLIGIGIRFTKSFFGNNTEYNYLSMDSAFIALSDTHRFNILNLDDANRNRELLPSKNDTVKIDLNKATKAELVKLPGIGDSLAERILAYRQDNGRFNALPELMRVRGIGKKKYKKIASFVTIGADHE